MVLILFLLQFVVGLLIFWLDYKDLYISHSYKMIATQLYCI